MKKHILVFALALLSMTTWAQENRVTLSGGYAFAKPVSSNETASGYRINGLYEFNPQLGNISHGFNVGYINTSYTDPSTLGAKYTISSWPIYYAPKIMFGSSDGRRYQGQSMRGVSVFDFELPKKDSQAKFYGYSCITEFSC